MVRQLKRLRDGGGRRVVSVDSTKMTFEDERGCKGTAKSLCRVEIKDTNVGSVRSIGEDPPAGPLGMYRGDNRLRWGLSGGAGVLCMV